uniref:Lipoprotein n=1 Tax=Desulfovibrio sp. U5L TaxID=596152 RepID=I2Q176_9BACT
MKRTVSAALAALSCLVILSGCGTMKTSWRDTKKLYRSYINTDPTIDFSEQGISDKGLQRLASLLMPVDERLMGLLRVIGSQDTPPESDWAQQLLSSHDWLSGVAVIDTSGAVVSQAPTASLRPLDFSGLLEFADRYKTRKMGAQVKTDEFGTVVMVAAPYFKENEWAGLVVAFFDPRNLVRFSPEPDALVVLSTDGLVWPGGSGQGEALAGLKWAEMLKGGVQGEVASGGGQYVWQARYLGQLEMVYLTDVREARAKKPEPPKAAPVPTPEPSPADVSPTAAPNP